MFGKKKRSKDDQRNAAADGNKAQQQILQRKREQAKASAVSDATAAFIYDDKAGKAALEIFGNAAPSKPINATGKDTKPQKAPQQGQTHKVSNVFAEAVHYLPKSRCHFTFSASHEPALFIEPEELLHVETLDCFGGNVTTSNCTVKREEMNPITGPIHVKGAMPGDVLSVRFHNICPGHTGFAICGPTSGQLSHTCTKRCTRFFSIRDNQVTMKHEKHNDKSSPVKSQKSRVEIAFPASPMLGVVGVAPEGDLEIDTMPAGPHGGNLDNKMNGIGSVLHLPVQHPGALLSIGDMHASQGDGEVCGTGVEVGGDVLLSCSILKAKDILGGIHFPVTETPTHWATHGVTVENISNATIVACEEAQRLLVNQWNFTNEEAFLFLSVAGDMGLCRACHPDVGTQTAKMMVPKIEACPTPFQCQKVVTTNNGSDNDFEARRDR